VVQDGSGAVEVEILKTQLATRFAITSNNRTYFWEFLPLNGQASRDCNLFTMGNNKGADLWELLPRKWWASRDSLWIEIHILKSLLSTLFTLKNAYGADFWEYWPPKKWASRDSLYTEKRDLYKTWLLRKEIYRETYTFASIPWFFVSKETLYKTRLLRISTSEKVSIPWLSVGWNKHSQKPALYSICYRKWLGGWLLRISTSEKVSIPWLSVRRCTSSSTATTRLLSSQIGAAKIFLDFFTVCCSVLQCVAVCCSALQCVAVCCSVLQCMKAWFAVLSTWSYYGVATVSKIDWIIGLFCKRAL